MDTKTGGSLTARDRIDFERQIEALGAEITEKNNQLSGLTADLDERDRKISTLNETIGNKDGDIGGLQREKREVMDERDRLNGQVETLTTEIEGLHTRLQTMVDEDPAEREKRAELERQEARAQRLLDEKSDRSRDRWSMVRNQLKFAGVTGIVVALFFLITNIWFDWEFTWTLMLGSGFAIMVAAGLMPQFITLLEKVLPQIRMHDKIATGAVAALVGFVVAILGNKTVDGDTNWVWFLMFMVTWVGYAVTLFFMIWGTTFRSSNDSSDSGNSMVTTVVRVTAFTLIPAFMVAFFLRPLSRFLGDPSSTYVTFMGYGPAEHLANTLLSALVLLVLIGIAGLFAWGIGLKVFVNWMTLLRKELVAMRRYDMWSWVSMVVLVVASILVGGLVIIGMWPVDEADTTMKGVAITTGLLSCVGFGLIKSKLLKAGRTPGMPWGRVFVLALVVVLATGYVSLGTFYKATSEEERINALVTHIGDLEAEFFNLTSGDALAFADEASTEDEAKKYTDAVAAMKVAMASTSTARTYEDLQKAVNAFRDAGSKVAIVNELAPHKLDAVKVPPKPSANSLLAHVLGISEAPPGVFQAYTGSLIKAIAAWLLAEVMVLIVFFILLSLRGKERGDEHVEEDGEIVGDMDGKGRDYLVAVPTMAATVSADDQANVFNGKGEIVASMTVKKPLSDGAFVMSRPSDGKVLLPGMKIRFI